MSETTLHVGQMITLTGTCIFQGGKCLWITHQPSFCGMLHFRGWDPKLTALSHIEILKYYRILLHFNTFGPTW